MADNVIKLKVDSAEYEAKLKRAVSGLQAYEQGCRKVGGTLEVVEKETLDYVKALGKMETVSKTAKGRIGELSTAFVELKTQYNRMTEAEKQSPFGKEMAKSLEQLKTRIHDTKKELNDINKEMNGGGGMGGGVGNAFSGLSMEGMNLNSILGEVGGSLGMNTTLLAGLSAGTLGLAGAIAAASAAAAKGAQEFKAYNDELARQSQVTSVTTGLKGGQAEKMTAEARAISDVYGTDFREVINAANTLMTQFGRSGDDAMQLIRDGMQGMIMGDGPKLLSMIQQYAPAFRDAGVSAEQLVAVIHNSEGGIFTDENMNAIVMGIKNIRLMTKATSDALQQLGIDGEQMTRDLNDGTMTIFEALQKVGAAIENVDSNSQAAGQVIQQVFGRQGVTAGTNLGKAIKELNLNLSETKKQTGEVGESFAQLERAQEDLEKAMQKAFGIEGWDKLTNTIEYGVTEAMTGLLSIVGGLYDGIHEIGNALGGPVTEFALRAAIALANPLMMVREILNGLGMLESDQGNGKPTSAEIDKKAEELAHPLVYKINTSKNPLGDYSRIMAKLEKQLQKYEEDNNKYRIEETKRIIAYIDQHTQKRIGGFGATGTAGKKNTTKTPTTNTEKTDDFEEIIGLIPNAEEAVKDLQKQIRESWDEGEIEKLKKKLKVAQEELQRLKDIGTEKSMATGLSGFNDRTISAWTSMIKSDLAKADIGSDVYNSLMDNLSDMSRLTTSVNDAIKLGLDIPQDAVQQMFETVFDQGNLPEDMYKDMIQKFIDDFKEKTGKELKVDVNGSLSENKSGNKNPYLRTREDGKTEAKLTSVMGGIAGGISQMTSGLEALGVELPEGMKDVVSGIQGVISVLTAISTIVSAIQAISAADAIIPFANGGIVHAAGGYVVPGNYNSGDMVPAALSSGEVVLNRAQQGVIANALQGSGMAGMNFTLKASGENLIATIEHTGKRKGYGELCWWK